MLLLAYTPLAKKISKVNMDKNELLSHAVLDDDIEEVKRLLKDGANPNHRIMRGRTPLHLIASVVEGPGEIRYDDEEMIRILIEAGAKIDQIDGVGYTPLIYAVQSKKQKVVKIFLDHKANVNYVTPTGRTALYWAARFGTADEMAVLTAKTLDQYGADPKICDNEGHAPITMRPDWYGQGYVCQNGYAVSLNSK